MNPDFKDILGNAKHLFSMHPAPWGFYNHGIDGWVVDGNGKYVFGGEACEGYVSPEDPEIVALVDLVNSVAVYMKGENNMKNYQTLDNMRTLVGDDVFEEVMVLPKDTNILVTGAGGPTGKTTVACVLRDAGYMNVKEVHDIKTGWTPEYTITLNKTLN